MPKKLTQCDKDNLAAIELAIKNNERCPIKLDLSRLAQNGVLQVDLYAENWRVATLLKGKYKDKFTMLYPKGLSPQPYRTLDTDGWRYRRRGIFEPVDGFASLPIYGKDVEIADDVDELDAIF